MPEQMGRGRLIAILVVMVTVQTHKRRNAIGSVRVVPTQMPLLLQHEVIAIVIDGEVLAGPYDIIFGELL